MLTVRLDDIASDTSDGKTIIHNTIEGYTTDITEAVENAMKYIVSVQCEDKTYSGVIVGNDSGQVSILTCYEAAGYEEVNVILDSGARKTAAIIGSDEDTDLCLLTIDVDYEVQSITLGDSDALSQGEYVIALSGKGVSGSPEVSFGVSSKPGFHTFHASDYLCELLTTDASVSEAQSGGALLNLSGQLVGILCKQPTDADGSMGYAISANEVQKVLRELQDNAQVTRGSLNISFRPANEMESYEKNQNGLDLDSDSGLLIYDVPEWSSCFSILNAGDLVLSIEGRTLASSDDYRSFIYGRNSEDEVEVTFLRDGETMKEKVVLQ